MNEWLASLEPRERLGVAAAAVVLVFALFWFALWQPLERDETELEARIEDWRTALRQLGTLQGELQGAGEPAAALRGANQSLVVIVDNTLRARNLYGSLQGSQPAGNDGIRVEFQNVAFDELVLWLGELGSQYGLEVRSASFSRASNDAPGRISASLTLER